MILCVENEFYKIKVNTLGAELVSVVSQKDGAEFMWQSKNGFWEGHAPVLFPICGKLKDAKYSYRGVEYQMAGHGFAHKKEFAASQTESSVKLVLSADEETRRVYPFEFTLTAEYRLVGDKLVFTATVENEGSDELPYMFGWHPAFALPTDGGQDINDYAVAFNGKTEVEWHKLQHGVFACPTAEKYRLQNGAYRLNEKEIYANDTMIFTGQGNEAHLAAEGYPFAIDMKWSAELPVLCIWKEDKSEAKFICIEPWTGTPNDGETSENFETREMARLKAGSSCSYVYTVSFKSK